MRRDRNPISSGVSKLFTGIVEDTGVVTAVRREKGSLSLSVEWELSSTLAVGDSIAVDGVCLTVVGFSARQFRVEVVRETLEKTTLSRIRTGDRVNLERAVPAAGRFGGHFVQGHVDGVGIIKELLLEGASRRMVVSIPEGLSVWIAPKGSIAVDGVSLTVVDCARGWFSVVLIPHTLQITTLGSKTVGSAVNIETDILAKYVFQMLTNAGVLRASRSKGRGSGRSLRDG